VLGGSGVSKTYSAPSPDEWSRSLDGRRSTRASLTQVSRPCRRPNAREVGTKPLAD